MSHDTPQLTATISKPLDLLEHTFFTQCKKISNWFAEQWQKTPPPVYGSVDLRNAGFKLAPIDMNLFPAGFNNLNLDFFSSIVKAAQKTISKITPNAKKILLIPESHTRNTMYWENIKILEKILLDAGFAVRFGLLDETLTKANTLTLASGSSITVEPVIRQNKHLAVDNYVPDLILLNNDLSAGLPSVLQDIDQPIVPPAELGWHQRLKSGHFQYYAEVAKEFGELINIDPWLIDPLFAHCGEINFMQQDGLECLIANSKKLFQQIQAKYDQYNINQQPFLIVKADAGTYGMAVMTVRNIDELTSLNRKQRTRMSMTKGGQEVHRVIVQEGVYTFETVGSKNAVAEPVVYLFGDCVIGGFYRVHHERAYDENLNAPGMHFAPIAFPTSCNEPCADTSYKTGAHRYYTYGVIAQLSMLAAAREIKGT